MNWDEMYRKGEVFWNRGAPSPPMKQYLGRHPVRGAFDVVLEHTCMSALPPNLRADYRRGIDLTLRRGGLLVGVWFIDPALDPGEEGPPFPFPVPELTALFADSYEIVEDYVPEVAFAGREGQERVRVLRRVM